MTNIIQNGDFFTDQGCLTSFAIKRLIKGDLLAKQESDVNKHIDTCNLCREALEGARKFDDLNHYDSGISELHKTWTSRHDKPTDSLRKINLKLVSVAASVAILLVISILWLAYNRNSHSYISDIARQGLVLDNAINNLQYRRMSRHQNVIAMNEMGSKTGIYYEFDDSDKKSVIPLGKIENTRVFARSVTSDASEYELHSKIKKATTSSHLSYPNVIMHKPPAHLDLKMPDEASVNDDVFVIVEEMPRFIGSDMQSFRNYIQQKIIFPEEAIEQHVSGRVYAQFTINRLGKLEDAEILISVHPALDREVLRVLNSSPDWQPGKQRDRAVSVSVIMPVDFYLY